MGYVIDSKVASSPLSPSLLPSPPFPPPFPLLLSPLSSIFMDPLYKKDLAINLTKNYCELQKNFVVDSHHHDVCVS